MLWAKVLRSPIAYGRIKKIDTNRAAALPGVAAVATGADVKGPGDILAASKALYPWLREGFLAKA